MTTQALIKTSKSKLLIAGMVMLLFLAVPLKIPALTNYVAVTGGDGNTGESWAQAFKTISNAVARADGIVTNTILVSNGVYAVTVNIIVPRNIIVRSWNAGNEDRANTIIVGGGACRVLYLNNASALFSGFTITNGNGVGDGVNGYGGGVYLNAGTLSNCIVAGNTGDYYGGGVFMNANSAVKDCLVQYNRTTNVSNWGYGGGLYVNGAGCSVLNSQIISNTCYSAGGGISLGGANSVVSNCLVAGNQKTYNGGLWGGGVYVGAANVLIIDSIISNNSSALCGGGIGVSGAGYAIVRNSTITTNYGAAPGGGIYSQATSAGGMFISNCIISYNYSGPQGYGSGIGVGYWNDSCKGRVTVADSKIIGNGCGTGRFGGGVFVYTYGTATFHNCEIVSNTLSASSSIGAGMYIGTGSACVVVQNCLVAGNSMPNTSCLGGGISVPGGTYGATPGPNPLDVRVESCTIVGNAVTNVNGDYGGMNVLTYGMTVWNTVVASNRVARNYPDLAGDAAYIAPVYYSCSLVLTNPANGNITNAPVFVDYSSGNYRMQLGSPGIDAGTNQAWMTTDTDLNGRARIDHFRRQVDMGAYEFLAAGTLFSF